MTQKGKTAVFNQKNANEAGGSQSQLQGSKTSVAGQRRAPGHSGTRPDPHTGRTGGTATAEPQNRAPKHRSRVAQARHQPPLQGGRSPGTPPRGAPAPQGEQRGRAARALGPGELGSHPGAPGQGTGRGQRERGRRGRGRGRPPGPLSPPAGSPPVPVRAAGAARRGPPVGGLGAGVTGGLAGSPAAPRRRRRFRHAGPAPSRRGVRRDL